MGTEILPPLLAFYGAFLITCGIVSLIFIGTKAKTALASGGLSGAMSLCIAYFISKGTCCAELAGLLLSFALFGVFAWRSTKTLFRIFEMLKTQSTTKELNDKGIAFLIISLMAVVSIFVFALQFVMYTRSGVFRIT